MKLFLDTEFNGFNGELISMALVSLRGREFYEVLECRSPVPWVRDNIIPILGKDPISLSKFKELLYIFLLNCSKSLEYSDKDPRERPSLDIYADWPEDLRLLMESLITGPGQMMNLSCEINLHLDRRLTYYTSKIPHNALEDARGIRDLYAKLTGFPNIP